MESMIFVFEVNVLLNICKDNVSPTHFQVMVLHGPTSPQSSR